MIDKFDGKYDFLSNFYLCKIEYEGIVYPSVEHAFQAAKSLDMDERKMISLASTPGKAKRMGRMLKLRPDWENIKDTVMYELLKIKFENEELRRKLSATGEEYLVEGNTWHDNYWGDCHCKDCIDKFGRNQLGLTLMKIRGELYK